MIRNYFFFLVIVLCVACKKEVDTLLVAVPGSESGIKFTNKLVENDTFNIIEYLYFYNGAGVSLGDINNDGLTDVYLVSNQNSNKLFLNKGNFKFEDITQTAGVAATGNWKTGTTMADVNGDGLLDIYVCGVGGYKQFNSKNQLYINQGNLKFKESAVEYGLDFQGLSTQAAFFDYDRDGDLDMYLLNHSVHSVYSYGRGSLRNNTDTLAGDRLFRNNMFPHGENTFEDVTADAGIYSSAIGYGLGLGVSDVNSDGFPDIYVSNDFHENDYLYLNDQDGTFTEVVAKAFPHTSRFSMGNDIADLNNDLLPDIMTTDMLPRKEEVIKTSANEDTYEIYQFKLQQGYHPQVSRNALQINKGTIDGVPYFVDQAPLAGVEATDWSWSPALCDLDGDGWKDLAITNGIARRPNNLDYINFISADSVQKRLRTTSSKFRNIIEQMPEGNAEMFFFKNDGRGAFEDVSNKWNDPASGLSNGMAYGDLDNDGDPDLVINRTNSEARVLRNHAVENHEANFATISLTSNEGNKFALGSSVCLYAGGLSQLQYLQPTRGWCSSSDYKLLFGLGSADKKIDSVVIRWPDGSKETVRSFKSKHISVAQTKASRSQTSSNEQTSQLLTKVNGIGFRHRERYFNAFNRESLMPHMAANEGPPLAKADIDNDGLDDFFVGGGAGQSGSVFVQRPDGTFSLTRQPALLADSAAEDTGAAWFDADADGDYDLIVVHGGQETLGNDSKLMVRLYSNDGKGVLSRNASFPEIFCNASCVRPQDYDKDGDVDIFIGSDVMPLLYGMAPVSYMLENRGTGKFIVNQYWLGNSVFDNVTRVRPGMVKDATWTHINNDGLIDLVLVGEWMPVTILMQQVDHTFYNATNDLGLKYSRGWWSTVVSGDIDGDGDMDLVAGNLGLNSRLKASKDFPLRMWLGDFDRNGSSDHILTYFNGGKSYPFATRDQLVKQLPHLKKRFLKYHTYGSATIDDFLSKDDLANSAQLTIDVLESSIFINHGDSMVRTALPREAQVSFTQGAALEDIDDDRLLDLLIVSNFSATQPEYGRYDAGIGIMLKGDGKGNFDPVSHNVSGFVVKGEARDVAVIKTATSKGIVVSVNNDSLIWYEKNKTLPHH